MFLINLYIKNHPQEGDGDEKAQPRFHRVELPDVHAQEGQQTHVIRGNEKPEPGHAHRQSVDSGGVVARQLDEPLLADLRLPGHQAVSTQEIGRHGVARNTEGNTFVGMRTHFRAR